MSVVGAPACARRRAVAAALVTLALGGCGDSQAGEPLPPAPPTVEVELVDHDVGYQRPVPAGRVVFEIHNAGDQVHRLALIPLPDDLPPIEEVLADERRWQVQLAARVPNLAPGETGMFAVDLAEGQRYALMDFSKTPEGTTHGRLGVADEFRAGETHPSPATPSPSSPATPAPSASADDWLAAGWLTMRGPASLAGVRAWGRRAESDGASGEIPPRATRGAAGLARRGEGLKRFAVSLVAASLVVLKGTAGRPTRAGPIGGVQGDDALCPLQGGATVTAS